MPDYSESKIYKIVCNTTGKIYIGSTTHTLFHRLTHHEADYRAFLQGKQTSRLGSFEVLENENYEIIKILQFTCDNSVDLRKKEQEVLDQYPEAVNRQRAYVDEYDRKKLNRESSYEWSIKNVEKTSLNGANFRRKNPDYNKIYHRNLREFHRSWGGDVRCNNCSLLKIDPTLFS